MYPVEYTLLSRLLVEERIREAEQKRQFRRRAHRETPLFLRLRHWVGEQLIRVGNRLIANYPTVQYQSNIKENAGMI